MMGVPMPVWKGASTNGWALTEQVSGLASHGLKLSLFACFQKAWVLSYQDLVVNVNG